MKLETKRLYICELEESMAKDFYLNSTDLETKEFVPDEVFESELDALEVIKYLMEQYATLDGPLLYALITKKDLKNIGYVQVVPIEDNQWEIGYHIAKDYRGKGYSLEALKLFIPKMMDVLNINTLKGITLKENIASAKILEKLGFVKEFDGIGEYQEEMREIFKYTYYKDNFVIVTDRLILRKFRLDDFDSLYEILGDAEVMRHYPAPFSKEKTLSWINWNLDNYNKYGFGLWAVCLKDTNEFIGDCGITIQNIDNEQLPEIGYHISKKHWRKGYATEAARACKEWAFTNTNYNIIYTYMKYTNVGSYKTAIANGMKKVKEYSDPKNIISYVYAITRKEWEEE